MTLRFLKKHLQNKRGQEVHENFSCFSRKKFIWGNLIFLAFRLFFTNWAWSNWARSLLIGFLNSQDMISFMITTGSLNSQDMTRILKQWRHDFSGKHIPNRYCMDIMWCLCVGQNSWFCKASLRICYVTLFKCELSWMLKTVINCHVWNRRLQN